MERILVVLFWLIVGMTREPLTPRMDLPLKMFPAVQSDTLVRETVPPEVHPAGIVYVPALVPIVPPVAPLFAMFPLMDPVAPCAVFPERISPAAASSSPV